MAYALIISLSLTISCAGWRSGRHLKRLAGSIEQTIGLIRWNRANRFKWRPDLQPAQDIVKLNEMIKAYAKENKIPYVDYYSALVDDQGGLPVKYSKDGVHPNPDGYTVMEGVILPILKKYVR